MSPRITYVERRFAVVAERLIHAANLLIEEYQQQGYSLTLRQLYYRFVAADLIPNTVQSYKRLGSIINDARLAGDVDWLAIEDRTRNLVALSHWDSPSEIIATAAESYRRNLWEGQSVRMEVWVEKEALADVVAQVANRWDVPYFACRGYVSQSEMWSAAQRLMRYMLSPATATQVVILHLGDHDPSGIDMTRDIQDRLWMFCDPEDCGDKVIVERIALNMAQVEEHKPPPNPAKVTDSRYQKYSESYGDESWELDALEPRVLDALIERHIEDRVDPDMFAVAQERSNSERATLTEVANKFDDVLAVLAKAEQKGSDD